MFPSAIPSLDTPILPRRRLALYAVRSKAARSIFLNLELRPMVIRLPGAGGRPKLKVSIGRFDRSAFRSGDRASIPTRVKLTAPEKVKR
jgi:hypothetical protein